jgi:hypothetical protein
MLLFEPHRFVPRGLHLVTDGGVSVVTDRDGFTHGKLVASKDGSPMLYESTFEVFHPDYDELFYFISVYELLYLLFVVGTSRTRLLPS